jgi:RNA polymerase sigma-70 factor (ECF subfamily)
MLHAEARRAARRSVEGNYVPLAEQDPAAWDATLIEEAEALLLRASQIGRAGRYQLEAAVQSVHAGRRLTGRTDWAAIGRIYDALLAMIGSPVVAINRAIAMAQLAGPAAGLATLDELSEIPRLAEYQPYWAARAGLLAQTDQIEAADEAYRRAIGLESDPAVRRFLQERRTELASRGNLFSLTDRRDAR